MLRNFKPDVFSYALAMLGTVALLIPLTRMAGLVTLLAALAYWLLLVFLRARNRPRP